MRGRNSWILALVVLMAAAPAFARVDFIPIEGGELLLPVDMTTDGSKVLVVGLFGSPVFTYTDDEGLVLIGNGGCSGGQARMSSDGSTIVSNEPDEDGFCQAARWDGGMDWTPMGSLPGALPCGPPSSGISSAYDTNNDTAVGLFWQPQLCKAIGGTWDVVAGMATDPLASTVPDRPTRGNGITDDGSVVVGWQDNTFGSRQAVKWVNGVQEYILDNNGERVGEAIAVNGAGTAIIGTAFNDPSGVFGKGWLWREGKGMIGLGVGSTGNTQSVPIAVSADGNTVVGTTRDFFTFTQRGWIWTQKGGFQWLDDFLKGQNAAGWNIQAGSALSADGTRIGGWGFDPAGAIRGFIINLKATGPKR